jgi:hypothetical protein
MIKIVPRPGSSPPTEPRKKKVGRTQAEIEHQSRVAELGCIVCRLLGESHQGHIEIHHVRAGRRRDDSHMDVLPLCKGHHTGRHGWHGDKSQIKKTGKTDQELLDCVNYLIDN